MDNYRFESDGCRYILRMDDDGKLSSNVFYPVEYRSEVSPNEFLFAIENEGLRLTKLVNSLRQWSRWIPFISHLLVEAETKQQFVSEFYAVLKTKDVTVRKIGGA